MKNQKPFQIYLFAEEHQKESEKYMIRSKNHDMFLQKVFESTLSAFDEKRRCSNEIESTPKN